MRSFLYVLILAICLGCQKNPNEVTYIPYIISKNHSLNNEEWNKRGIPPPPPLFYGNYNFLVDNHSGELYLHRKGFIRRICGTGYDPTKPNFIDLSPNDVKEIHPQDLEPV